MKCEFGEDCEGINPLFATRKAQALFEENFVGSGKWGKLTLADVREYVEMTQYEDSSEDEDEESSDSSEDEDEEISDSSEDEDSEDDE